jgi:hypothetical protein
MTMWIPIRKPPATSTGLPTPEWDTPGMAEARAAHQEASAGLIENIHRGPETREAADRVHAHSARNHWADLLEETMHRRSRR